MLLSRLSQGVVCVLERKTLMTDRYGMLWIRFVEAVEAVVYSRDGKLRILSLPPDPQSPSLMVATR
jgi:hypothetical protein